MAQTASQTSPGPQTRSPVVPAAARQALLHDGVHLVPAAVTTSCLGVDERDGVTLVASLLVGRQNGRRTLHSMSSVSPLDPSRPAYRAVLVVTFALVPHRR
ncbi:hypothetical protein [Nocardia nova]|uniref:hypothetical protein n=1 Tax=Nocardia nova TaxID=37330 RepID=UPI0011B0B843|nr:hypothetical protein [Nocardia nova]